jgi:FKBP-type peptidyl-prolyl cis-trans isomerase 2
MATTAQNGSNVTIHYVGTLEDGTQFDSSRERGEPMTVTLGDGQLISGFNDALVGMTEGDTKEFTISSDDAYGPHHDDRLTPLQRSIFPEDFELTAGMTVPLQNDTGQNFLAVITEIDDETVTADFNHPLAGKDLTFTVDVLAVGENEETDS